MAMQAMSSTFRTAWCTHRVGVDGRRRVVLFASKLAACAGMHPYQDQAGMRLEFRQARGDKGDAMVDEYVPPEVAAARAFASLPAELREKVDKAVAVRYDDASAVVRAETEMRCVLEAAGATEAADAVRTALFTQHGSRCEAGVREAVMVEGGKFRNIVTDGRFRVTTVPWLTVGEYDVYVGGKHDGIEDGRVIEIKTRQRRFLGAPLYERIQTHAYMHVYGLRQASLIESYLGEQREHDLPFDDVMWEDVHAAISAFVATLGCTGSSE